MTDELIVIESQNALEIFTATKGLEPFLLKIREEIEKFKKSGVLDVSTAFGRSEIASMAYRVTQSKTCLDKIGKELVDRLKEQPKLVDGERKRMRDLLVAWND